jgi:hypothetical protein
MPLCQLNMTLRDLMWILSSDSTSVTDPISSWECNLSSNDLSSFLIASRTRSIRSNAKEAEQGMTFHLTPTSAIYTVKPHEDKL